MTDLRARQRELARQAIVDACAELVTERHHLDFSMKEVAERSGVSLRTVYNHFATREDLLDALGAVMDEQSRGARWRRRARPRRPAATSCDAVRSNMQIFERLGGISEAFAQMPLADVGRDADRAARTKLITDFIARQMPSAPADDAHAHRDRAATPPQPPQLVLAHSGVRTRHRRRRSMSSPGPSTP